MKKIIIIFISLIGMLFGSVGTLTIVKGDVSIKHKGQLIQAKSGTKIDEQDEIITKGGSAQIVFDDATVITVGANTVAKVAEYLYDGDNSKASFNVTQGIFKVITGKIGKINPKKFQLQTKTSNIGIRGTNFRGIVPINNGEPETIACTQGAIIITPLSLNVKPVEVMAGFMTTINQSVIEKPKPYLQTEIKEIDNKIGLFSVGEEKTLILESNDKGSNTNQSGQINESNVIESSESLLQTTLEDNSKNSSSLDNISVEIPQNTNELSNAVAPQPILPLDFQPKFSDGNVIQNGSSYLLQGNSLKSMPLLRLQAEYGRIDNYDTSPVPWLKTQDGIFEVDLNEVYISSTFAPIKVEIGTADKQQTLYFQTNEYLDYYAQDRGIPSESIQEIYKWNTYWTDKTPRIMRSGMGMDLSEDYSSWGYWEMREPNANAQSVYELADGGRIVDQGYWVTGQKTPNEIIQSFIAINKNYSYYGHIMGFLNNNTDSIRLRSGYSSYGQNITDILGATMNAEDLNDPKLLNMIKFNVAFGETNPIRLEQIRFTTQNRIKVDAYFNNTVSSIDGTNFTFTANATSNNTSYNGQSTITLTNGTFFGPRGESVGGTWSGSFNNGALNGSGVFKASNQTLGDFTVDVESTDGHPIPVVNPKY